MSESPAIRLRDVSLRADQTDILVGVDWEVQSGSMASIVGTSGSGKSQLLRLLNRLRERSGGDIEVLGKPIEEHPVGELRVRVGWVPQRPDMGDGSAREALEVPLALGVLSRADYAERLDSCVDAAQLDRDLLDRPVTRFSGGERHRLAIARALLLSPEVLLLDEPTSALDGASAARLLSALDEWRTRVGATIIVVTHRLGDVQTLGGSLLVLEQGRVVRSGPHHEVLADPASFDVRAMMTGQGAEVTA